MNPGVDPRGILRAAWIDLRSGAVRDAAKHRAPVTAVALARDGGTGASGDEEGGVIVWAAGAAAATPLKDSGHKDDILSVAFTPDGQLLSASRDMRVVTWDVAGKRALRRGSLQSETSGRTVTPRAAASDAAGTRLIVGGQIVSQPCDSCLGQGRLRKKKALNVKVPQGVDNGDRIRLTGEGEAGRNGGPPGDLYVEIHVREHPIFERDGAHLSCEVPVSFATAALGGTVEVPTLDGNVELKIPHETQSGRVFRLREKGVKPVRGGATGDLFCRIVVETPVNLTEEQRELLRKFDATMRTSSHNHSPREHTWLDGVKSFFGTMRS